MHRANQLARRRSVCERMHAVRGGYNRAMPSEPPTQDLPAVTVAAVTQSDGRFLVVEERISGRLVFNQPAGHVEPGETLLAAVAREAQEETAWRFTPEHLLGVYRWRNPDTGAVSLRFAFCGSVRDHDPAQVLDQAIVRTHWLSREELASPQRALRSPLVLRCIDDFLAGTRLPLAAVAQLDLITAHRTPIPAVAV
jgi:8-oxo-dGTP pyrophosphatase MutT (NUDIX family)